MCNYRVRQKKNNRAFRTTFTFIIAVNNSTAAIDAALTTSTPASYHVVSNGRSNCDRCRQHKHCSIERCQPDRARLSRKMSMPWATRLFLISLSSASDRLVGVRACARSEHRGGVYLRTASMTLLYRRALSIAFDDINVDINCSLVLLLAL